MDPSDKEIKKMKTSIIKAFSIALILATQILAPSHSQAARQSESTPGSGVVDLLEFLQFTYTYTCTCTSNSGVITTSTISFNDTDVPAGRTAQGIAQDRCAASAPSSTCKVSQ